jgi:hypothetical protein
MEPKGCMAQAGFIGEVLHAWLRTDKKNGRTLLIHGWYKLTFFEVTKLNLLSL